MKHKISITMDQDTIAKVDAKVLEGKFRNRSHFLEYASVRLLNE